MNHLSGTARLPARTRTLRVDRVSVALCAVFLLGAAFYLWTAATTFPLSLYGGQADHYNQLADAFLHLHLSVGRAPAGLLSLPEPYNPAQNEAFQAGIHDLALYRGNLFLTWGPAPVVVLLVPMHLLGFAPSSSLTAALFAIAGLGFALAALRVLLRQIGVVPLWICALAAFTLALCSTVPFILRRPEVYEEAIAGGYCFAMAGIWLAVSALAHRRTSSPRLALMSLCFGLAIGSRPTLGLTALLLVPVYMSLRALRPHRGLLMALAVPVGCCLLLLLAYNQARFGSPLEYGTKYQLAGTDQYTAHFGDLGDLSPGAWFYAVSPPRVGILFPFIFLNSPPIAYPGSLPANYSTGEPTGGLLAMAPIAVFLVALPWIRRRRPRSLGTLALPLLMLVGAGIAVLMFLSYEFSATTERYEVDFATLLLLGALAAWLVLSNELRGWRRRVVRIGGGVLAVWGCLAGLAVSFTGYYNLLALAHPDTWRTLEDIGSPLSRAIATVEGHPVLAEVSAPEFPRLSVGEQADLVIVSPDTRTAALLATVAPAARLLGGAIEPGAGAAAVLVRGPGNASSIYPIRPSGEALRIPVRLGPGLNRIALVPLAAEGGGAEPAIPIARQLLLVDSLSLASRY